MAVQIAESFTAWEYDAGADRWRSRDDPANFVRTLEDLTDGLYFQRGGNIYRGSDSAYLGRIATIRGSTLQLGSEGTLFLNNSIAQEDINQLAGRHIVQRAEITVTIPGIGEQPARTLSGITSLTSFGAAMYTGLGAFARGSELEPLQLVTDARQAGEPRRFNAPLSVGLMRRGTPTEVLNRSISGWLARNAFDQIAAAFVGAGQGNYADRQRFIEELINHGLVNVNLNPFTTSVLSEAE